MSALFDLHVRHVKRVLRLAFPVEADTEDHAVVPLVREFWHNDAKALAAKGGGLFPWVEAIRQLELQRRAMMERVPEIGRIADTHESLRAAVADLGSRLEAVESASYGQMMELVDGGEL